MNRRLVVAAAGLLVVITAACGPEETKVATKPVRNLAAAPEVTSLPKADKESIEDSLPFASTASTVKQASVTTAAPTTTAKPYVAPTTAKPYVAPTTAKPYTPPPTSPPATNPPASQQAPCHPSYTPCIPDQGTDVDCAGGSGDGPRYVQGPVQVHGPDEYRLDNDGDGVGCTS
jgi:hypothetical protein